MTLGQKVKMAMAYSGVKQKDLSVALGMSPQNFGQRMRRGSFNDEELRKMADVMGARYYAGFFFGDDLYPVEIPPMEGLKTGDDIAEKALHLRAEIELLKEQDEKVIARETEENKEYLGRLREWHESDEYKAQDIAQRAAWEAAVQERMQKLGKQPTPGRKYSHGSP